MKKNPRTGIIFVIAMFVLFSSMSVAFASERPIPIGATENQITPYWIGLNTITNDFQILSGGIANPSIRGITYPGEVDYVNVSVNLKKEIVLVG